MSANALFFTALMLVLPAIILVLGLLRSGLSAKIGAKFGYKSELSVKSPEAWAYAQKACVLPYVIAGVVMAALSLWFAFAVPQDIPLNIAIAAAFVIACQIVVVVLLIAVIEGGLRKLLGIQKEI